MDQLGVEVTGLSRLRRDLRKIGQTGGAVDKNLREALYAAGEIVARDARDRSSWSTRIPGSIHTYVRIGKVAVKAGGPVAPHAVTFEGKVNGGNRRHPVYATGPRANWTWATQVARPFMRPALEGKQVEVEMVVADALEKAFIDNGWHH